MITSFSSLRPNTPALSKSARWIFVLSLGAAAMAWMPVAKATPYATCLTNDAGTIWFRLNESADSVQIVSNGGATTNALGPLGAGLHTFALGISGTYQVVVSKASPVGFTTTFAPNRATVLQISTDSTSLRFNQPRGLAVNTDPASPYFGRVYISNSQTTNAPLYPRNVGDGIYVLNSDLSDAVGQGDAARNGGLDFGGSATASPYRLAIGRDNNLYICDWSDASGSLYVADPDVSAGQNVLGGSTGGPFPVTASRIHGSIAGAVVEGSLAGGDLRAFTLDEDLQDDPTTSSPTQRQSLWRHEIGSVLPGPTTLPTRIALHPNSFLRTVGNQTMDIARGTNGYFYVSNYRSTGGEGNLWVLDANGTLLWNSLTESRAYTGNPTTNDLLRATGGNAVSPRGDYVAVINIETNGITILPLINGLPDITNRAALAGFAAVTGTAGREVAFDLAGNLYAVTSGSAIGAGFLRVFSPGGTTTAITGSDGTFTVTRPPPVSVTAVDSLAGESGDTGAFSIYRTGDTSEALTVSFTLTGTATNGVDYSTLPLTAVIPAGETSVVVTVEAINDTESELPEFVVLSLVGSPNYDLATPASAQVDIADDDPVILTVTGNRSSAYERLPQPFTFTINRVGDTNLDVFITYSFTGTATEASDYQILPFQLYMAAGHISTQYNITLNDDTEYEGDETVVFNLITADIYTVGSPGSVTNVIRDDELPPACVLYSDNLDADTSGNWTVRFAANNGVPDSTVAWAYDYGLIGIPPAPRSVGGTSRGLFVTVNKADLATSPAGINLYPNGQQFSGNYALRFDLYMNVGNSNQTEHALAGLNHSGSLTNWVSQNPLDAATTRGNDGVFVAINSSGGNLRDYGAYTATNPPSVPGLLTNRAATNFTAVFTAPPYVSGGSIGNASNSTTRTWAEVELLQLNGTVALRINNSTVFELTNTTGFNSGNILIGYNDQFASRGSELNFAIFDNVQIVQLDFVIKSIQLIAPDQVQIDFVSPLGGLASEFHLQSGSDPAAMADDNSATITAIPEGFRAVTTQSGSMRFYKIRR